MKPILHTILEVDNDNDDNERHMTVNQQVNISTTLTLQPINIEEQIKEEYLQYHTNPVQWTCGCPYFLNSRFLFCKPILSCYKPISNPVEFFRSVQRQQDFPF